VHGKLLRVFAKRRGATAHPIRQQQRAPSRQQVRGKRGRSCGPRLSALWAAPARRARCQVRRVQLKVKRWLCTKATAQRRRRACRWRGLPDPAHWPLGTRPQAPLLAPEDAAQVPIFKENARRGKRGQGRRCSRVRTCAALCRLGQCQGHARETETPGTCSYCIPVLATDPRTRATFLAGARAFQIRRVLQKRTPSLVALGQDCHETFFPHPLMRPK
jgi:hypothetical protein